MPNRRNAMSFAGFRKWSWSLALAGLALAGAATAGAPAERVTATGDGALSKVVRYADLDLATEEGVTVLYRRLRAAAEDVCRPLKSPALASRRPWRECYDKALGDAVAGIGNERLATRYRGPAAATRPQQVSHAAD
jgi:UrcA family protein